MLSTLRRLTRRALALGGSAVVIASTWLVALWLHRVSAATLAAVRAAGQAELEPLVTLTALGGVWLCLGWLVAAVLVSALAAMPALAGSVIDRVAGAMAPLVLRRVVAGAIGAFVVVGVTAPAHAADPGHRAGTAASAASAATAPTAGLPALLAERPAALPGLRGAVPSADRPSAVPGMAAGTSVTVMPGDTLWSIVARALGPQAAPSAVADAWPLWWEANRSVIGADPGLLRPGQVLTPPIP
ncbi:LysM peptidoglycan-binding domain-containing protein [Motilibacter aurantiacus]|uniref:LysM peptidoglycan-binding domain-containing protein n=1 Tax=Motilibacter aurantiacus TaxID=2714955 RepID=UPI00140A7D28|nr:LysM domain-containing protein [Motilibacter aurantiacus]NHC43722.1 LysM peptidoglycan-binding domain-containing protein [Motilibacter aurantiacus]